MPAPVLGRFLAHVTSPGWVSLRATVQERLLLRPKTGGGAAGLAHFTNYGVIATASNPLLV